MKNSLEYYQTRISIDRHNLADQIAQHVDLNTDVMREATFLKYEVERQKLKLDELDAATALRYRDEPSAAGKKRTVDEVKNLVTTDTDCVFARQTFLTYRQAHEEWATMSDAYRHRGYAMRELVELYNAEMSSDPATIARGMTRPTATRA